MSTRVLITGGSGFIGTNLQTLCKSRGAAIMNVDCVAPRIASQRSQWFDADVRDVTRLNDAFQEFSPTRVIHLAARTDLEGGSVADYSSNVQGTEQVIRCANGAHQVESVVVASTRLVTPVGYVPRDEFDLDPDTYYGESKVMAERACRSLLRRPWIIARPTSIWGPWFGTPYLQFFQNVIRGTYVHPRGVRVLKTFGYVENTARQLYALALTGNDHLARRTIYLGDPAIEVGEFADLIATTSGNPPSRRVPGRILSAAARAGDIAKGLGLGGRAPLTTTRLHNLTTDMVFELEDVAEICPDRVPVETGIRRTLEWMDSESELPTSRLLR